MPCRGTLGDDSGQGRARAVAAHGNAVGVGAELTGMCVCPEKSRFSVFYGRRVGVLRREAVADRQDMDVGVGTQQSTDLIDCVEVPGNEPATVVVDKQGTPSHVLPRCAVPVRSVGLAVGPLGRRWKAQ